MLPLFCDQAFSLSGVGTSRSQDDLTEYFEIFCCTAEKIKNFINLWIKYLKKKQKGSHSNLIIVKDITSLPGACKCDRDVGSVPSAL